MFIYTTCAWLGSDRAAKPNAKGKKDDRKKTMKKEVTNKMLKKKTIRNILRILLDNRKKWEKTLSDYYQGYLEGSIMAYEHTIGDQQNG